MTEVHLQGTSTDTRAQQNTESSDGRGHDRLHLTRESEKDWQEYGISKPSEWYCRVCRARVSVTPDRVEVGHQPECPRRPEHLGRHTDVGGRTACVCPRCGEPDGEHLSECPKTEWACPTCEADGYSSQTNLKVHHSKAHGEKLRTSVCPHCNGPFAPRPGGQTYCSPDCAKKSRRNREERHCDLCGGSYECVPSSPQRYCGHSCEVTALTKRETRHCDQCGGPYEAVPSSDQRYCSPSCSSESQKKREERYCDECGGPYEVIPSSDQRYCSPSCSRKARRGTRRADAGGVADD